jgi:ectoine hydrolase
MHQQCIDAMLCVSDISTYYLSGADCHMLNTPQVAVVRLGEDDPWLITRKMDVLDYVHSAYVAEGQILGYEETAIGSGFGATWRAVGALAAGLVRRCNRIGVDTGALALGGHGLVALRSELGDVEIVDTTGLVDRVRSVKSPAEITAMREAVAIAEAAFQSGLSLIQPGARQSDVAARIMYDLARGKGDLVGSVWPHVPLIFAAGVGGIGPHRRWSSAPLEAGMQINIELGAYRHRYPGSLARTVHLGAPPPRLWEIHEIVTDGFEAAKAALRPGATGGDVHAAFMKSFGGRGVRKDSRIGYSLGIDWQEGAFSLQANDTTPLQIDQTCHLIIGIWEPEESYVLSETLLIENSGATSLGELPRDLFVRN